MSKQEPVAITGVWLRSNAYGIVLDVLVERDGKWYKVITENRGGPISHIVELSGILKAQIDDVTS